LELFGACLRSKPGGLCGPALALWGLGALMGLCARNVARGGGVVGLGPTRRAAARVLEEGTRHIVLSTPHALWHVGKRFVVEEGCGT